MAATRGLTKEQQDRARAGIQTTQLINRLQNFALGKTETRGSDGEDPKPIELNADRIRAIDILLKKALPDLSAVKVEGSGEDGAIVLEIVRFAKNTPAE